MNEKLTPDLVSRITADIKASVGTDDFRHLLQMTAFHQMGPRFAVAGISPRTAIGREIAVSLMATVEVAAEAGIHAYLARTLDVPLEDLVEVILPEAYAEAEEAADDSMESLVESIGAALEEFFITEFADDAEREAYREAKAEFRSLDHSKCRALGGCVHREWFSSEFERRVTERRARAAAPEADPAPRPDPDPEPVGINAATAPLTPEQQDRRYPGLPRGSDD